MKPIRLFPLFFFFCISTFTLIAQTTSVVSKVWEQATGHPTIAFDHIATARQGTEVFIVGNTYHFGEQENFLITKYNTSGVMQWQKEYNSISSDRDFGMDAYIKGTHLYVTGFSWDSASNDADLVTLKLTLDSGNIVWTATYAGAYGGYDAAAGVRVDNSGNVYVAGSEQTGVMDSKMIVVKYNSSGTQQWVTAYDSTGYFDGAVALDMDAGGSRLKTIGFSGSAFSSWDFVTHEFNSSGGVTGYSRSANPNGGISKPVAFTQDYAGNLYVLGNIALSPTNNDIKLIKYDTLFNQVWVRTFGCADSLDDEATAIAVDGQGRVIISGFTSRSNGATDMLTLKYDKNGSIVWSRTIASPDLTKNATGRDVKVEMSAASTIYVAGKVYNNSNYDYLTASYTKDGDLRWVKYFDYLPGSNDVGIDIVVDNSNYVYVSGICVTDTTPNYVTVKYKQATTVIPTEVDSPSTSLGFYENRGQILVNDSTVADSVFYYTNAGSPQLYVGDKRLSYVLAHSDTAGITDTIYRIDMVTGSTISNNRETVFDDKQTGDFLNYFLGNLDEPVTYVKGYNRIVQKEIYPGIDWQLYSSASGIKNYFVVQPNADTRDMRLKYYGADSTKAQNKRLTLYTQLGNISYDSLIAYTIDTLGNRTSVTIDYNLAATNQYSFNLGGYTASQYLVIEQELGGERGTTGLDNITWSTYYGGIGSDYARDVKTDANNNVYVTGYCGSANFPVTTGAVFPSNSYGLSFLVMFNSASIRQWGTFFGGTTFKSEGKSIAINSGNGIFICGETSDSNFPLYASSPAYMAPTTLTGTANTPISYLTRFNANGLITWSTYFPGKQNYITFNSGGQLYLVGSRYQSSYFPFTPSSTGNFFDTLGLGSIVKFNTNLEVVWATGIGSTIVPTFPNNLQTQLRGITVAPTGNVYFVGVSDSSANFPIVTHGGEYSQTYGGGDCDGVVIEFNNYDSLLYSTYIGGEDEDHLYSVASAAINDAGEYRLYICGGAISQNFPTVNQTGSNCYRDTPYDYDAVFITMNTYNQVTFSTYYGGTLSDRFWDIVVDKSGKAYTIGYAISQNIQIESLSGYYTQSPICCGGEVIVARFWEGTLEWSTYVGGKSVEDGFGLAIDKNEQLYIVGLTSSAQSVIVPSNGYPIYDPSNSAYFQYDMNLVTNQGPIPYKSDAFITRFALNGISTSLTRSETIESQLLYPNPTCDYLNLLHAQKNSSYHYAIHNSFGELVVSGTIFNNVADVTSLSNGFYVFTVQFPEGAKNYKFIKQ